MTSTRMAERFRGFLPVVVDVETSGVDPESHGILELGAVFLKLEDGLLEPDAEWHQAVTPHAAAEIDPGSMKITGIDLANRTTEPVTERAALGALFLQIRRAVKAARCSRAVLVAHNAWFDHQFINQAARRHELKRNPFHPFTSIDTASLAAVAYGHTVLREACARADIPFDPEQAHSALYDARITARLFCTMVNDWQARR